MADSAGSLVDALRLEVAQGFLAAHARADQNTGKTLEAASFCYALIELLEEKGIISFEELDERQKAVSQRLVQKLVDQGVGAVVLQEFEQDKYAFDEEVELDCESRTHLCRAACCRLEIALTRQDVEEGVLKWDLGRPYFIARDVQGYCQHLDRATCRCTVWQHRPIPCRGYDCRQEKGIWLDFENRVVNPGLEEFLQQGRGQVDEGGNMSQSRVRELEVAPRGQGPIDQEESKDKARN